MKKTLFEKVWESHIVVDETEKTPAVLYIDTHLIHEVTSPQAFDMLSARGLKVRRPDRTFATMDHSTPTTKADENGEFQFNGEKEKRQVEKLKANCEAQGITLFELGDNRQGIVHVIGPEQGLTQPGKTIVCGDSHTSTHGAFGALAFGIGTSEVGYTFATQTIPQRKSKTMGIKVEGTLPAETSAKDLILAIIAKIGIGGATGHVIEYFGSTIRSLNMDERMTICNMSIEAGARAGMIAPDEKTFNYLKGKPYSPKGEQWDNAVAAWSKLFTDEGAAFDKLIEVDASQITPMLTYGTNPEMAIAINQKIPKSASLQALNYMGFKAEEGLIGRKVDVVFIGSCTNSRITDIRAAANVFLGRKKAEHVRALVVPGSHQIKAQAEAEGLHNIFLEAGVEWREPGCSMCLGMNGDIIQAGQICISTSNRNFEGRQGPGGRTMLASPQTAAACAVAGKVISTSELINKEAVEVA